MSSEPAGACGMSGRPPSLSLSDVTPAQRSQQDTTVRAHGNTKAPSSCCDGYTSATEIQDIEADPPEGGDAWNLVRSSKKRRKDRRSGSGSSSDTVLSHLASTAAANSLTVIFVPRMLTEKITHLSSIRVSQALEKMCPECIIEVRYNFRLNLIAVDTRNGMTTRALLSCTELCGVQVRAYQPLTQPATIGVIKNVDDGLPTEELCQHLRSEVRIAKLRRLGQSSTIMLTFLGDKPPAHVLLGHVRHPVFSFKERPIQCRNCCGFGHREAVCQRPVACRKCGEGHRAQTDGLQDTCKAALPKCANCGDAHEATSPLCPKWLQERAVLTYAKEKGVDYRAARSVLKEAQKQDISAAPGARRAPTKPTAGSASSTTRRVIPSEGPHTPSSYAAVSRGQHKRSSEVSQQTPTVDVPPTPVIVSEQRTDGTSCTSREPQITVGPGTGYGSLITMIVDMACSLLSKINAPWAQGLLALIKAILPLFPTPATLEPSTSFSRSL